MRKIIILLCLLGCIIGCSDVQGINTKGDTVEIRERLFVAQINDIYLNAEDYIGKVIKYEGLFTHEDWEEMNISFNMVYRKSPGCCGFDGQAGFEVYWSDGSAREYPKESDWCEVVGILETYELLGTNVLRIRLQSLTVLDKRGKEFVSQ